MHWPGVIFSVVREVLACKHLRAPVSEGKCYCPDCGRGVIFQWVTLRCETCRRRMPGKTWLRRMMPAQRSCAHCGARHFRLEALESPLYFEIHTAQLTVREAGAPLPHLYTGLTIREAWANLWQARDFWPEGVRQTFAWLDPSPPRARPIALLSAFLAN